MRKQKDIAEIKNGGEKNLLDHAENIDSGSEVFDTLNWWKVNSNRFLVFVTSF